MAVRKRQDSASGTASPRKVQKRTTGSVGAAHAKAHLLSIIDEVRLNGAPVIVTRRGKPQVQIAPLDPEQPTADIFGCMEGTVTITGDIIGPEPDEWDAVR